MPLTDFLTRLRTTPDEIEFAETLAAIEAHYDYTPTAFRNGDLHNAPGQNAGSCKILAFAQLHALSQAETLACFGRYFREDVLRHPGGSDHANIRTLMRTGLAGVHFEGRALKPR